MDLTRATVRDAAAEYEREEPLYTVEAQHVETLPDALAAGEFGRRDGIWVVRWFRRRYLGNVPDSIPNDLEDRFEENGYRDVVDAVTAAGTALQTDTEAAAEEKTGSATAGEDATGPTSGGLESDSDGTDVRAGADLETAVDHLRGLEGVGVPVASAFCFFLDPDRFLVMSDREWTALHEAGELEAPYPDSPTVGEYEAYLETIRSVADRLECDLWTLYRALWRLGRQ
ncbi:hypothetical protein [Natrarchaeobaculum aegyptiacum]|uniref:Uncharacterized protein n=1 Tax=Natrarchaeobaculum aegyptiacum TaxID=745377 RepID=A0A2Z2HVL0_9EURY|nr:hypothetical protein [Natrarchaeobaculum aegyptiacum]ARS89567.1 hypothetical protein B1756_07305 [Natrarchaeobaculum aegyptiacum]